jgi:PglZ domain
MEATRTLPVATLPVVRAYVRQLRKRQRRDRVLGIRAQPIWTADTELEVDAATVRVRPCVSALAVREALVEHADHPDDDLVVITDVDDDDLGHGIRSRLADGHLHPVKLWDTVKESFAAAGLDPLLAAERSWAARALVDHEPASGWPAAPGGMLTRDFALGRLAAVLLGNDAGGEAYVDDEHVDAQNLLRWSLDPVAVDKWLRLDQTVRDGLGGWLSDRTGSAGRMTLRAVSAGRGNDAVALGLVTGLLWHDGAPRDAALTARGHLSAWLGGEVGAAEARAWSRTAGAFVSETLAAGDRSAHTVVERAEVLLGQMSAARLVALSDQLPGAFRDRLRRFAATVPAKLPSPSPDTLDATERAHAVLQAHDLAATDRRAGASTMALRLLRWLAILPSDAEVTTLADALDRQTRIDAWVDRAYADVWTGDPDPEVSAAYAAVVAAVAERRVRHDEQLARLLARATADDAEPGRIVPVEEALARVVKPVVDAGRTVLLVVVDGMSTGVLTEVAEGLRDRRWTELVDGSIGARQAILPVLPTLTQASRTSLLTGRLATGSAVEEKAGFAAASGDPKARLFHKDDLRAPAGEALAHDVRAAISDQQARVVGVVLNTVDDALDKMDPGGTTWSLDQIQHLSAIVEAARVSGRVVILTADHGHVVERGGEYRPFPDAGGARWRPASTPADDGELEVRGRRVLLGDGAVLLPWRENLRYTPKRAGYHGGASAAEVAVPLALFDSGIVQSVAGWVSAPPPEPVWWLSPLAGARPTTVTQPGPAPTLFDTEQPAAVATVPSDSIVDALLASETYAVQRRRAARAAPDDTRVQAIVGALLRHDGRLHETTLATVAHVPATRMRTVLAAVRRVLSVEGYEALSYDPDGVTVVLDLQVLREQFGLEARS